jgi:hypothetical protein
VNIDGFMHYPEQFSSNSQNGRMWERWKDFYIIDKSSCSERSCKTVLACVLKGLFCHISNRMHCVEKQMHY